MDTLLKIAMFLAAVYGAYASTKAALRLLGELLA
jgi:hypothetical protein